MKAKLFQVDAFTNVIGKGNPAAVVPLIGPFPDDETMQTIAMENNLSETAFVTFDKDRYTIRWFTPLREVDLCGHATIAAAQQLRVDASLPPAGNLLLPKFQHMPYPLFRLRKNRPLEAEVQARRNRQSSGGGIDRRLYGDSTGQRPNRNIGR